MPGFDPAAWWLAEAGGRPAGILLGDDSRVDVGAGFVRTLGVCEWARGRGIAKALLATAFNAYAERGRSTVMLGVDSQNQTGATALYESMGMAPAVVYDSWALTLTPAGEGVPATRSRNASTSV